ncbi:MAG: hypothetical protein WAM85_01365 [Terracidiphilus sp.]
MIDNERKLVVMEPRDAKEKKKVPSGAEDMRAAADLVLQKHCMEIAEKLAASSLEGHIQSSRFLYVLADKNQELGVIENTPEFRSLALVLANEPQWPGESSEETAETEGGSREPEG